MKKRSYIFIVLLIIFLNGYSQVGIGTITPDTSAILDVSSSTQGFLMPRMSTLDRLSIATPAEGLWVYNTDTDCFNYYTGSEWMEICGDIIFTLDCVGAVITGTLSEGVLASGVSAAIDYTGANGDPHSGQLVNSTDITGLTATLTAGNFAVGAGTLTYNITGTPSSYGTANFAIDIGGETCTLSITVSPVLVAGCPGTLWMNRNLGASQVASSNNDPLAYGDLYQWGRGADGHHSRTSNNTALEAVSAVDNPGHSDFIITNTLPRDWRIPQNNNLWQGEAGINNPCPSGMRIPTISELDCERQSWASSNSAGAFSNPLKWTIGGFRKYSDGIVSSTGFGEVGEYWSSTISGTKSEHLDFSSTWGTTNNSNRAYGFSVRCIKD